MAKRKRDVIIETAALPDDVYKEALLIGFKRMRRDMHIMTRVGKWYISTNWVEAMDMYETMVFDQSEKDKAWQDIECKRTKRKLTAIKQHCNAVERYAKNA